MQNSQNKKSLYELIFTIALPVLLLNKLSTRFGDNGPVIALVVALSFPVGYFFWDYLKTKHVSFISILGFCNILLTGGFALFQLNSTWFAVKEMSIPLLIGLGILYTAFTQKPLVKTFLSNDTIINTQLISEKLKEFNTENEYFQSLKTLTIFFSLTFFVSSALNYILSVNIVTEIPIDIPELERMQIRNEQIADMTWKSYFIILAPSLIMISLLLWRANSILKRLTQLSLEDVIHAPHDTKVEEVKS